MDALIRLNSGGSVDMADWVPVTFAGIEADQEASAPEPLGHRPDSPSLGPPKLQRLCTLERLLLDLEGPRVGIQLLETEDAPKPLELADDEPRDAGAAQHENPAVAHAGVIFEVNAITNFVFNKETLADGEKGRPVASDLALRVEVRSRGALPNASLQLYQVVCSGVASMPLHVALIAADQYDEVRVDANRMLITIREHALKSTAKARSDYTQQLSPEARAKKGEPRAALAEQTDVRLLIQLGGAGKASGRAQHLELAQPAAVLVVHALVGSDELGSGRVLELGLQAAPFGPRLRWRGPELAHGSGRTQAPRASGPSSGSAVCHRAT